MVELLRFANIFLFALVAGTYTFEWIVVRAALKPLPAARSAQFHDALFHHLPDRYMPPAGVLGGLALIALLVIGEQSNTSTVLYAAGFVLMLGSAIVTFAFSRPIDRRIGRLVGEPDAAEYGALRRRWDQLITIRAPMGLIGLGCCVAAALNA